LIRLDHVTKSYRAGARAALADVSVEIEPGEFVFLVGASGSGKSTLLRLLLREEVATSGSVEVLGRSLNKMSSFRIPRLRRQVGCVFQDFRLLPNKTVVENIGFALQCTGHSRSYIKGAVPEVLELVGLRVERIALRLVLLAVSLIHECVELRVRVERHVPTRAFVLAV